MPPKVRSRPFRIQYTSQCEIMHACGIILGYVFVGLYASVEMPQFKEFKSCFLFSATFLPSSETILTDETKNQRQVCGCSRGQFL